MRYAVGLCLTLLLVILSLMACGVPVWAESIQPRYEATRKILAEAYGKPNARGTFVASFEGTRYDIALQAEQLIDTPYGKRLYLVAQGEARNAGHVTAGLNGLFVAEERQGVWTVVAATPYEPTGGFGTPGGFHGPLRLGGDHYYGWILESGYTSQGMTSVVQLVLAPFGKKVIVLAKVGSCLPADEKSPRTEVSIRVDTALPQERVYPLLLQVSAVKAGRKARVRTVKAPFHLKTFRYEVPKSLAEGGDC